MEAETKCPPFRREHIQMHFTERKCMDFVNFFHWGLFLRIQLTIFWHWFRKWLGAVMATSPYLYQWWLVYRRMYASLGLKYLYIGFIDVLCVQIKCLLTSSSWYVLSMPSSSSDNTHQSWFIDDYAAYTFRVRYILYWSHQETFTFIATYSICNWGSHKK